MSASDVEVHDIAGLCEREADRRMVVGEVVRPRAVVGEGYATVLRHLADEGCTPRPAGAGEEGGVLALLYEEASVRAERILVESEEAVRSVDDPLARNHQHVTVLSGERAVVIRKSSLLRRNASLILHLYAHTGREDVSPSPLSQYPVKPAGVPVVSL